MIVSTDSFAPPTPSGFIVVEGVNGAGKSTIMGAIEAHLKNKDLAVRTTFEPGDTVLGKELRKLLLNSPHIPRNVTAELLLFGADRGEHVDSVIKPALADGQVVLCDRYLYSMIAFQGYGRGLDLSLINQVNALAIRGTLPDLVILLDIDAEEGLRRTRSRSAQSEDVFELETVEFHRRIRQGFLSLAESRPEPFFVIDAHQPLEQVKDSALSIVDALIDSLKKHGKNK